ncbi:PREDICTED: protein sickie-like [Calidris pugnax]|uniref:protein sickie-like n=1 Tax=Calidris pugnax TaxID=198806 RepID=UPI00071CD714|nr:PREDICTED: protein sickie-like [Calidris pugnax]
MDPAHWGRLGFRDGSSPVGDAGIQGWIQPYQSLWLEVSPPASMSFFANWGQRSDCNPEIHGLEMLGEKASPWLAGGRGQDPACNGAALGVWGRLSPSAGKTQGRSCGSEQGEGLQPEEGPPRAGSGRSPLARFHTTTQHPSRRPSAGKIWGDFTQKCSLWVKQPHAEQVVLPCCPPPPPQPAVSPHLCPHRCRPAAPTASSEDTVSSWTRPPVVQHPAAPPVNTRLPAPRSRHPAPRRKGTGRKTHFLGSPALQRFTDGALRREARKGTPLPPHARKAD